MYTSHVSSSMLHVYSGYETTQYIHMYTIVMKLLSIFTCNYRYETTQYIHM